jgi:hypothetical protein
VTKIGERDVESVRLEWEGRCVTFSPGDVDISEISIHPGTIQQFGLDIHASHASITSRSGESDSTGATADIEHLVI